MTELEIIKRRVKKLLALSKPPERYWHTNIDTYKAAGDTDAPVYAIHLSDIRECE